MGACFEAAGWKCQDQVHNLNDVMPFIYIPMAFIHTVVSERLLSNDLAYVWRWYPLGIQLGVPEADLRMIEKDYKHTEDMKLHMLSKWMRIDEQPSWSKVVRALVAINERHVARNIAEKYGKFIFGLYSSSHAVQEDPTYALYANMS